MNNYHVWIIWINGNPVGGIAHILIVMHIYFIVGILYSIMTSLPRVAQAVSQTISARASIVARPTAGNMNMFSILLLDTLLWVSPGRSNNQ